MARHRPNPYTKYNVLLAEHCNISKLTGLKEIMSENKPDVNILDVLHEVQKKLTTLNQDQESSELAQTVQQLSKENEALKERLQKLEVAINSIDSVQGDKGDKGDKGNKGDKGDKGRAGAKGDSLKKLSQACDVDVTELVEGSVLMWSHSRKKWLCRELE